MISKILSQGAFWMVNKSIAKALGCNDSALLLSYLIGKSDYHSGLNQLIDGYFYCTSDTIQENVNISYHVQKKCIDKLKSFGFISTTLKGLPAKVHFMVHENKISNFLNTEDEYSKSLCQSIQKNIKLNSKKVESIKNKELITDYKEQKEKEKNQNFSSLSQNQDDENLSQIQTELFPLEPKRDNDHQRPEKMSYQQEIEILFEVYNDVMGKRSKVIPDVTKNYTHWRKKYTPEQIEKAIRNVKNIEWWNKNLQFETIFRRSNNGDMVDRIAFFLNETGTKSNQEDVFDKIIRDDLEALRNEMNQNEYGTH